MQAPIDEKKLFVLRYHASHAFSTVAKICKEILDKEIPASDPLYHPLMIAIYSSYGLPFTNCWGFGKLPADTVPAEFQKLHEELMTHRDKMYAHADKGMVNDDYGPANELRVTVSANGRCRLWTQPVQPSPQRVTHILKLAQKMHAKMGYWTDKFIKKYMQKIEVEPGDYLVDTENPTQLLAKRDAEQANRERLRVSRAASLYGTPEAPHP
jgi:hypothetical protein